MTQITIRMNGTETVIDLDDNELGHAIQGTVEKVVEQTTSTQPSVPTTEQPHVETIKIPSTADGYPYYQTVVTPLNDGFVRFEVFGSTTVVLNPSTLGTDFQIEKVTFDLTDFVTEKDCDINTFYGSANLRNNKDFPEAGMDMCHTWVSREDYSNSVDLYVYGPQRMTTVVDFYFSMLVIKNPTA